MWDDERIEAAIDEAARQMTAGEADAAFRARVMARIDTPRRPMPLRQALAAGIAAAAAIAIAVIVWRQPTHTGAPAPEARSVSRPAATGQSVSTEPVHLQTRGTVARTLSLPAGAAEATEFTGAARLE